jgi:hypothetical protein
VRRRLHRGDVGRRVKAGRVLCAGQARVAEDRHQEVVEVVGDAAASTPSASSLAMLLELRFDRCGAMVGYDLGGHVLGEGDHRPDAARIVLTGRRSP